MTHFEKVTWRPITVLEDGSCHPPPKTKVTDHLRVKMCYSEGANIYNVVNLTQGTQCFVELAYFNTFHVRGTFARCNHPDCFKWQHTVNGQRLPCKHIRATVRWHVKLTRRAKKLAEKGYNDESVWY